MANYNDILKKYGLDNTPPSPSSYDDILNKYGVKPTPSATLGDFTVEQTEPTPSLMQRAGALLSPAIQSVFGDPREGFGPRKDEDAFQQWYADRAAKTGLSPNPDDPEHKYDYRAAFAAGAEPQIDPEDGFPHWPSEFKADDHPNRFVMIDGQEIDTKYDRVGRGRIGPVGGTEVPELGFIPNEQDVQSAPVRESLFARAADSASRMAQPIVSGLTAPVIAGASTVPAQARAVAGGAQQAYAELTPDWMFPLSEDKEIESIRQTVGDAGAERYARSQQEIAAIKEEALAKGADPFTLDAAISAPTTAAMLGGSMVNPALGLGLLTGITGPQSYAGFRAEGLSPSEAAQAAVAETAAEVVPSIVPAAAIARSARLGRAPAALAVSAAEAGQEGTTDILQQANRVALGLQDSIDLEQSGRAAGLGAALGAPFGAAAGRRIPVVETGIPVTDAAAQATADIQAAAGVSVEPTESSQNAVSPPTLTTPTSNADTAVQSVTERSRGTVPRSEKIRARLNLQTGQLETEGGLPVNAPSAADFERAEMETGINLSNVRQQEYARQRGVDVDGLLNNTVAPQETPPVMQNAAAAVEAPVAQAESQPETPSNSNYIRRAMQLANEEGIDATPEWLQQRVSHLQNEDVSEMAIRGGVSPSTLSYYMTAEDIPQEYKNTTPPPENQLPAVNAIKTATNAREAVDALRPLIQSESLRSFADKIGTYIDLAEIPVITVNPEDAGRDIGAANYLVAKGKERTVGAYSPATREIYLKGEGWKNNGMNAEALLHELQHAASVHVYEAVERGTLTDNRAVKAVNDIKALASEFNANSEAFASFPKETRDRLRYAASNPKEFMAITQTSPLVQSALKKEGLWKRFVNAIRGMFGYSRSETPLLERILTAGDAVMGAQQQAQLATAPPAAGTVVNEADYAPGDLTFEENVSQETPRQAQTKTRSFRNWFGDSKVVDANGDPLVVYHGTKGDFNTFDPNRQGETTEAPSAKQGVFFTDDPSIAAGYSSIAKDRVPEKRLYNGPTRTFQQVVDLYNLSKQTSPDVLENPVTGRKETSAINRSGMTQQIELIINDLQQGKSFEEAMQDRPPAIAKLFGGEKQSEEGFSGDNVMPVYLSIKNPLIHDFKGQTYRETTYNDLIRKAKEEGRDGAIFLNTYDEAADSGFLASQYKPSGNPHSVYVAFNPKRQIKSAIGNSGDFSLDSANINEMAIQSQSTRDRLREEESQRSAKHYDDTPAWVKNTKRIFSWTGAKDVALAKQQEALTLQKAALGVPEREIAKRGDRIQSIIKKEGLDSTQALLDVDNIIRGNPAPNANQKLVKEASRIRSLIDGAQAELLQAMTTSGADPRATEEMVDQIYNSIGSYISRSYLRSFYKPGPVDRLMSRGREGGAWTKMMKAQRPDLYQNLVKFIDNNLIIPADLSKMDDQAVTEMAERYGIATSEDVRSALANERSRFRNPEALRNFLIEGISAVSADSPIKVVRQAARDEGILEHRQDVPKVIREWWGEITDPVTAAAITFDKIGTLAAETRFLNNILTKGLGVYVFDSANPAPTGESLVELNNAKLGPLNGKLVREELKQFLDTQIGLTELKSADDWKELASMIGNNLVVRPGGIAKGMATVWSIPTMAMNVQSNVILAINDAAVMGLMAKLTPGDKFKDFTPDKLIKYSVQDVFNSINNSEQVKKLVAAGVLRDGISLGELRSTVRNLERKLRTEAATTRGAKLSGAINQKVQSFSEAMADFYQLSDNLPRLIAFSSNLGNLSRAFPDLNQKEIWDMAADRARDMTPTFGRASPTVKVPAKVLGNFATWMGEVVRTYAKRYDYAISDINRGRKEGNARLAQFGAAQLVATSSSLVANALAIPALIGLIGGAIGDDDTEENIKQLAPEYLSDKNLIAREIDRENKRIFVWNTTRNDPAAPIQEVANRIDRSGDATGEIAGYIRDTVLQPGMYLEGLATAAFGYRRPTQSLLQGNELRPVQGGDRVRPLVEAFNPGSARQAVRAVSQYNRGSDSTTQLERVLGLPIEEIDVPKVVTDKTYAYRNDKRAIEESLRTDISSPEPLTEDDFKEAVSEYLVDSSNLFEDLKGTIKAAKDEVGMTDAEIATILKDASGATNRTERTRLLRGEFVPRKFTREWLDGAEEKALRANVRDPAYAEQVKQEFKQRRKWLSTYLGSPRKWQPLLENDNGS